MLLKVIIVLLGAIKESWQFDFILPLKNEFNLNNPFIIFQRQLGAEKKIFKEFSNHGEYVSFKNNYTLIAEGVRNRLDIIFIPRSFEEFMREVNILKPYENKVFAILSNPLMEEVLDKVDFEIKQEIYFINESTNEIFESYSINGIKIKRKLGRLCQTEFHWNAEIDPFFVTRRSNFQGVTLKAFTEETGRDLIIDSKFRTNAPYFANNNTYLVNGFVSGLNYDILRTMEANLNFTTLLYKQKETIWGSFSTKNGTVIGTGIIGEVFEKRADFVIANVGMVYER